MSESIRAPDGSGHPQEGGDDSSPTAIQGSAISYGSPKRPI